jgi:RHS repeat-associated protein
LDSSVSVATLDYAPYGETRTQSGSYIPRFRFSSKEYDSVTKFYNFPYRYYSSQWARWVTRDPIEEVGGFNLYAFAENIPTSFCDAEGLAGSPCADPCGSAKKKGLDKGDVAGVICCGGKKYSCVWKSGGATGATNKKAKAVIDKCSKVHEDTHHGDVDCPSGPGVTRPPFKPGLDPNTQECKAFKAEVACLDNSIAACGGDPKCISQVNAEKQNDEALMKDKKCKGCP